MKEVKDEYLSISLGTAAARSLSFHPARYLRRDVTVDPNVFETANAGFAQAMYEEFLRDPTAVDPEWRRLFESGVVGERDGAEAGTRGSGEGQRGGGGAGRETGEAAGRPPSSQPKQAPPSAHPL